MAIVARIIDSTFVVLALIFAELRSGPAAAKDLTVISSLVVPAYTAMNFVGICAQDSRWVASQPRGPRGAAIEYAQHVKDEAIGSLTFEEAVVVLRIAADGARSTALQELKKLRSIDSAVESSQIEAWCRGCAHEFITAFINGHDDGHHDFLQRLDKAKQ